MFCVATAGEKIQHLRRQRKPTLTQDALAKALGVTRSQLANYESNRTEPPAKLVRKLARAWGIPEEWFWDGSEVEYKNFGSSFNAPGFKPPELTVNEERAAYPGVGRRMFPILGTVGASAFPLLSAEETGHVEFADDLYRPERFAIKVIGDSMSPRIEHGDYVLVQPNPQPPHGLITVIKTSEHEYAIKVRRMVGGQDVLEPLNPHYGSIEPADGMQIVGFVVGIRRERGRRKYLEEGDDEGLRP